MAELTKKEKEALHILRDHSKLQSILAQLKDVQEDMETDGSEEVPKEVPSVIAEKLPVGDLGQTPGKAVMQEVHLVAHRYQPGGANNDHLSDQIPDHSSVQVKVHSGGTLGTHSCGDSIGVQGDTVDDVSLKLGSPELDTNKVSLYLYLNPHFLVDMKPNKLVC
ncbi:hypothetical protein EB796_017808 [Bugula neritina]|uniref:Uncharacterized protein n=1 Tax=Bugula neritina TaxID=10212 RepID=A0A7J7JCW9_BUGNE|nr:hypothetical protein EB796_017808 [Bugula neritina]